MKNMVITSLSALYDLGIIKYKPNVLYVEMVNNTNISNYSDRYKISCQSLETINIGRIIVNSQYYYCIERLFIELDKFPLENTIKTEAIKNLEERINPQLVYDIYNKIKKKRRGIDHTRVNNYLQKNLLLMHEILSIKNIDKTRVIREYIMALLAKLNFPTSLIKGGSAIELYLDFKRATDDIDTHIDKKNINTLLNLLEDKTQIIYFDILNKEEIKNNKLINSFILKAKSRKLKINQLLTDTNEIKLTLNYTYNDYELNDMIIEYSITKTPLKLIQNAHALVFSREMLLAEKYQSLISKNKDSTRTKDLIDLVNIYNEDIDFKKFKKFVFRKWKNNSRNKLLENEVIDFVKKYKDMELTKIKDNFNDALKMYNTDLDYNDSIQIYKKLSDVVIDKN